MIVGRSRARRSDLAMTAFWGCMFCQPFDSVVPKGLPTLVIAPARLTLEFLGAQIGLKQAGFAAGLVDTGCW